MGLFTRTSTAGKAKILKFSISKLKKILVRKKVTYFCVCVQVFKKNDVCSLCCRIL